MIFDTDTEAPLRTGIVYQPGFDLEGCKDAIGAVHIEDRGILHDAQRHVIGKIVPDLDILILDPDSLNSDVGRFSCASVSIGVEILVVNDRGLGIPLDKRQPRPPLPLAGGQAPSYEERTPATNQMKPGEI